MADEHVAHDVLQTPPETPNEKVAMSLDDVESPAPTKGGSKTTSLPLQSKLAHLLAIVITGVIALFVSAVLADGQSVIRLRDPSELPRLTDPAYIKKGLDYRADELLGPNYGVGLHHDSSNTFWTKANAGATLTKYIEELGEPQVIAAVPSVIATDGLKHPVHFLTCKKLKATGLAAFSLAIIAEVVSALMIIFHGLALVGLLHLFPLSAKLAKLFSVLIWFTLTTGFMIVIGIALGIMQTTWTCENPFIPKVKIADHFQFTYGIVFGYIGYVSALLVMCTQMVFTSSTDGIERPANSRYSAATKPVVYWKAGLLKVIVGVIFGCVINAGISLAVVGGVGYWKEAPPIDPEFNYCEGQKPYSAGPGDNYFKNVDCMKDGVVQVLEQAGANITRGYKGGLDAGEWRVPITDRYINTDLCPVNVHWHLGAEHYSVGQFDQYGTGPADYAAVSKPKGKRALEESYDFEAELAARRLELHEEASRRDVARELAKKSSSGYYVTNDTRLGFRCRHYDKANEIFTKPYEWKYCTNMQIGETYEVHWPHSAAGACDTPWQYQTPFYDGVFCKDGVVNILTPLNTYKTIGVEGQVYTIVNSDDPKYYQPNMFAGMIYDKPSPGNKKGFGEDIAMYTGSTTGTTRDNTVCSRYSPITWQVDRTCHMVSAKSFDEMCKKMLDQKDDMSDDLYPHGARNLTDWEFVANNQQSRI